MQISISGHHVEVTDSLRQYVIDKLEKIKRHSDLITSIQVILTVEKLDQQAEAIIHVPGAQLFAEAHSEDMYQSIDALVNKLDRQVLKHKEKIKKH